MNGHSSNFWPPKGKGGAEASSRPCDHPGCRQAGEFRAPKSRQELQDYYWFCLDHVRAYNQAWDYYAGCSPEEIERVVRSDVTWQRPTWPLGRLVGGHFRFDPQRVKDPFSVFSEDMWQKPSEHAPPPAEEAAMRLMDLKAPLSVEIVRARYRELCKLHHPDANGGDKESEERFKQIGQAYKTLMESLNP